MTGLFTVLLVALAGLNVYQCSAQGSSSSLGEPRRVYFPNDKVIKRFYEIFAVDDATLAANKWLGIETLQNPMDVWITQEIIVEVVPDFIVETGTYKGGSAALWAMILEQVNPEGRIISVDIVDFAAEARKLPIVQRKVDLLLGSSTSPEIVGEITRRVAGKRVLMILDSNHHMEHVLNELKAYAPLVEVGSYIIVQDGLINGHPISPNSGPGPWEAVEAFLETTDEFEVDKSRERLILTYNPNGFLKRVR
ncbi:MAG: CmcI family methyltransferase [Proteobacteria bacterium]|nr:CmcI family methyltransferase [Pseudomonadota bacterium]